MATLSGDRIAELLEPYYPAAGSRGGLVAALSDYLDLLMRWNARINLSAIREPEEIVSRHFGESLFAAAHLPPCRTLLDLGSGAGFPGVPIALVHPGVWVTLAESQNRKGAFLREVARALGIQTEVWAARVETMPPSRTFDVVTMRAVDRPEEALKLAWERVGPGGSLVHLGVQGRDSSELVTELALPGGARTVLRVTGREMFHVEHV